MKTLVFLLPVLVAAGVFFFSLSIIPIGMDTRGASWITSVIICISGVLPFSLAAASYCIMKRLLRTE